MIFARNLILVLVVPWPGARATGLGSIQINPQQIRFLPSKDEKTEGFFFANAHTAYDRLHET